MVRSEEKPVGLVSFDIFINDLDGEIECNLSNVADDTELGGAADTAEGHAAIQRDVGRLRVDREEPGGVQQGRVDLQTSVQVRADLQERSSAEIQESQCLGWP